MIFESPKSLTATVHVRFKYSESAAAPVTATDVEMLNNILDRASELSPDHRELLVKFAEYINGLYKKEGQSST